MVFSSMVCEISARGGCVVYALVGTGKVTNHIGNYNFKFKLKGKYAHR